MEDLNHVLQTIGFDQEQIQIAKKAIVNTQHVLALRREILELDPNMSPGMIGVIMVFKNWCPWSLNS